MKTRTCWRCSSRAGPLLRSRSNRSQLGLVEALRASALSRKRTWAQTDRKGRWQCPLPTQSGHPSERMLWTLLGQVIHRLASRSWGAL